MWWGGASSRRAPSSMPVGYASQTGYQYDSISRVAGQREPAPPSKFSKEGGFKNSVFKGISESLSYHSQQITCCRGYPPGHPSLEHRNPLFIVVISRLISQSASAQSLCLE